MLRVLILHGWNGSGPGHWQSWLADRLRAREDVTVRFPDLPACEVPCPDRWGAALHPELEALDGEDGDDRVVVCHSLGCVLWLREAARVRVRPERVLLVAPPGPGAAVPELAGFYPTGADRDAVHRAAGHTRLVCADDDPYCPEGAATVWGAPLGLEVDLLPGQGHLNVEAGYGPWPQVEAWVLGERDVVEAAQAGAKNGAEM